MNATVRKLLGAGLALAVTVGVTALSRVPYGEAEADEAVVRLSWRTRAESVRECRTRTPEELAQLPVHMRQPTVCEGAVLPFHLAVDLDGRPLLRDTVRAAGARGDRPLYVFHEFRVTPGTHALVVRYEREDAIEGRARREEGEERTPALLHLSRKVDLRPGEVVLITYDPVARALVVPTTAGRAGAP